MKRVLILLISLLVSIPLALGVMAGLAYYSTSAEHIPNPSISIMDQTLKSSGYKWRTPVFGGLIYRDFIQESPARIEDLGELTTPSLRLSVPDGYDSLVKLTCMGETVWSGRAAELADYEFLDNGRYRMFVECKRPMVAERGYGSILYQAAFSVVVEPRYESSDEWVTQGDVLAVRLYNLSTGLIPTGESELGEITFVPGQVGQMTALVPVGCDKEPGSYAVYLSAGHFNWEILVRVTDGSFRVENLEVAEGSKAPYNASDYPEEYKDFQEKVVPVLEYAEYAQYWEGSSFEAPVKGDVVAEYGLVRYINATGEPRRHMGIDIAAEKGTEIIAPNRGLVVFAEEIEGLGNTVVIEHGGGLKSLFFHMDSMDVVVGDTVEKSQKLGTVGRTGIAASTHLHYEVRLGNTPINPNLLYNGSSKIFFFNE